MILLVIAVGAASLAGTAALMGGWGYCTGFRVALTPFGDATAVDGEFAKGVASTIVALLLSLATAKYQAVFEQIGNLLVMCRIGNALTPAQQVEEYDRIKFLTAGYQPPSSPAPNP